MKYVLLVSHGTVAPAMHSTLNSFFLGNRPDLLDVSIRENMTPETFATNVRKVLAPVKKTDDLIVLADIMGGSPITYASAVVNDMGLLNHTYFLTGMNLPTVLNVMLKKDTISTKQLCSELLSDAKDTIRPFTIKAENHTTPECI